MKPFSEIAFVLTVFLSSSIQSSGQALPEHPWGWEKPPVAQNLAWQRKEVEGFAYPHSVKSGDSVHLYISVLDLIPSSSGGDHYDIDVYRVGGTDTLVLEVNNQLGYFFPLHTASGGSIPWGNTDTSLHPVEYKRGCLQYWQNGHVGFSTAGWKSGVYYAKLIHLTDNTRINYVPFVVKAAIPGDATNILLKYELTTFQAYNYWGGGSLYSYPQDPISLAYTDSIAMDRPLTFTQAQAHTYFLQSFLKVLADSGYIVEYCDNVDLDKGGTGFGQDLLAQYDLFILWNHDEYWSTIERDNIEFFFKGEEQHGNIARFAPNTCYWRINWEGGGAGSHLRLGCLKGNYPPYDSTYDLWRWNGTGGANRPEAVFLGSQYETGYNLEERPDSVTKPSHWIFRNANLDVGDTFGVGYLVYDSTRMAYVRKGIIAGEIDNTITGRAAFPTLDTLAERGVWSVIQNGEAYLKHQMVYYEDTTTNSRIFAQGAAGWILGLVGGYGSDATDMERIRTITTNIISHFSSKKYIGKVWTTGPTNALVWDSNVELDGNVEIPTGKYLIAHSCVITIDSSFSINGTLEINGNVTIAGPGQVVVSATGVIKLMDGATLIILGSGNLYANAGAQFEMGSGSSITVNGVFHAEGTANNTVKFLSAQSASAWNGISAYNTQLTSSADLLLDYVEISGASRALHVKTSMPATISNSTINGTTEIAIEVVPNLSNSGSSNEDVLIDNVTINTEDGDGIVVVNTSLARIQGCTINGQTQESTAGLRFDNASPVIVGTKVESFYYGVLAVTNSAPVFQDGQFGGYNIIRNNIIGVQCEYSNAVLGIADPETEWEGGMNSIYHNESYNVVLVESEVYAQNNWWGDDQGPDLDKFSIDGASKLYYEPWLDYNPNGGSAPLKVGGKTIASLRGIESAVSLVEKNTPEPMTQRIGNRQMREAITNRLQGKYQAAIAQLRNIVESESESLYVKQWAVSELLSNTGRHRSNGNSNYLRNLQNEQLQTKIRATLPPTLVEEHNPTQAATEWNQNINSSNNDLKRSGLYGKFMLALYKEGSVTNAASLETQLRDGYANSSQTKLAARQLRLARALQSNSSLGGGSAKNVAGNEKSSTIQKPKEFALHQNYPNPFNPSTTINFDLPEPSQVSLVLYDVLGRRVTELVNAVKEAGYHSTTWNASAFASGVYFARFIASSAAGRYTKVNKLLLAK